MAFEYTPPNPKREGHASLTNIGMIVNGWTNTALSDKAPNARQSLLDMYSPRTIVDALEASPTKRKIITDYFDREGIDYGANDEISEEEAAQALEDRAYRDSIRAQRAAEDRERLGAYPKISSERSKEAQSKKDSGAELFPTMPDSPQLKKDVPTDEQELKNTGAILAGAQLGTVDGIGVSTNAIIPEVVSKGVSAIQKQLNEQDYFSALQELQRNIEAGIQDEGLLDNSIQFIIQERTKEDEFLAEKKFIDSIYKFQESNPAWRDLVIHQPSLVDKIIKEQKNDLIIQSWIARKRKDVQSTNPVIEFMDDLGEFIQQIVGSDFVGKWRTMGWDLTDYQYIGQKIRELDPDLVPQALEELYAAAAKKSGYLGVDQEAALENIQTGAFGSRTDISDMRDWWILDGVLLAADITGLVGSVSKRLVQTGAQRVVLDDAIRALENTEGTIYARSTDAVEDIVGGAPRSGENSIISEALDARLRATEMAIQETQRSAGVGRLSNEELQRAVDAKAEQLEYLYNREGIMRTQGSWDSEKGVYLFDIFIGKKDNTGFATESTARGFLSKNNISGEVVQLDNGFFIKQTFSPIESLADDGLSLAVPTIGPVRRLLQSPKAFVYGLLGRMGTAASYHEAFTADALKKVWKEAFGPLSAKEINEVGDILNGLIHSDTRKWHTPEELQVESMQRFKKELSEDQLFAYYAYKQLSDAAYWLDNSRMYKEAAAKGLDTVELSFTNVGKFNGNVYTSADQVKNLQPEVRVYNAAKNVTGKMPADEVRKLIDDGYILVRPDDASWTKGVFGEGVEYILTKSKKSVRVSPLDPVQLSYVAGGRRTYSAPFYIGQQVAGTFSDGGKYLLSPNIFRTANTVKEAQAWVDGANRFMEIYKKVLSGEVSEIDATKLFKGDKSYQDYVESFKKEGWDIDTPFKFKKDRQDFPIDDELNAALRLYAPDDDMFMVRKNNRLSARGEFLKGVDEEQAATFDYLGTLNRNINQAVNAGVYSDFKIAAINRFNTSYRRFMENLNMSPYELATKGTVAHTTKAEMRNEILAHQQYIRSILRQRGNWDEMVQRFMDNMATRIENGKGGLRDRISTRIHKDGSNPLEKVRAINFDLNLGMYNPKQFLTQLNSVLISLAISPKYGLAAAKDLIPLRYALIADDVSTSQWINGAVRHLTEGSDIDKAASQFKRIGLNSFGSNLAMMDGQSTLGAVSNRLVSKGKRFIENGRVFFQEGERGSRIVAYGIARRKFKELFPKIDEYGVKADTWIREEADRILLSPNADNNALIHKGIGSIPTQFWSYMMKLSDAMFTGSGGRYTGMERARIAGAQIAFYGAAGMPFLDYMLDQAERSSDQPMDPVMYKALHNGIIDLIPFIASGGEIDINFAGNNGIGGFWSQLLTDLMENPLPSLAGGATGRNLQGAWRSMVETSRVYGLMREPSMEAVTETALAGILSLTKSMSAYTQALVAWNTGIWYDKYGRAIAEVSGGEALASLAGAPPQAEKTAWTILRQRSGNKKKHVEDIVPAFKTLIIKYNNAQTQQEKDHIQSLINALSVMTRDSGYNFDVASNVMSELASDPTIIQGAQHKLMLDTLGDKKGVNRNLLTKEQIEYLRNKGNK